MASGLAARIKDIFGITAKLVDGHNGIYEVAINGQAAATNQGECTGIPAEDDILSALRKHIPPLPGKEKMVRTLLPMV